MRPAVTLIALLVACASAFAADETRTIVVLHGNIPFADVAARSGARVEADLGDRLVIVATPAVLDALRRHAAVKYIQSTGAPAKGDVLEPPPMELRSDVTLTWTSGDYAYDGAGDITAVGTPAAPGTQGYRTYGYDTVTRLTKTQVGGVTPGAGTYEYSYDAYGNRTAMAMNQQWVSVPIDSATNRFTDANYDESGNQLNRGVTLATYDGFGMMTRYYFDAVNSEVFAYNASDERIGVLRGTTWTWSLRDAGANVIRQYQSSSTSPNAAWLWVEDFVYRDGLLLGAERVAEEGGRRFHHLDHLGSPRLVTGTAGSVISERDFLPFGEERTLVGQEIAKGFDREDPLRFTGHERDFDVGQPNDSSAYLDYMHARYYASRAGRFMSPDPVLGEPLLPQSWNRYAYVLNNPVNLTDPDGLRPRGSGSTSSSGGSEGSCTIMPDGSIVCGDTTTVPEPDDPGGAQGHVIRTFRNWDEYFRWYGNALLESYKIIGAYYQSQGAYTYLRGLWRAHDYHRRLGGMQGELEQERAETENEIATALLVNSPQAAVALGKTLHRCGSNVNCRNAALAAASMAVSRIDWMAVTRRGLITLGRGATGWTVKQFLGPVPGTTVTFTALYGDTRHAVRMGRTRVDQLLKAVLTGGE